MNVSVHGLDRPSVDWNDFASKCAGNSIYHRSGWALLAEEAFGHKPKFLEARDDAHQLCGILPLVRQKSRLFGTFATSVPFFNYGGALATDDLVALSLMESARAVAESWDCSFLELRDRRPRDCSWSVRTDKVSMILDLPDTFEQLARELGSKLRSQVKRAEREQSEVSVGCEDLLDGFYDVFCENMRDLGTPTYPKNFFALLCRAFPKETHIVSIKYGGEVAASAFLIVDGANAEVPWAACRKYAKPLGFNMKLYWEALRFVSQLQCKRFDFGRSTVDAGTFKFKKQWGASPVQLYWYRWERQRANGRATGATAAGRGMRIASRIWQRLPLSIANRVGPRISPYLPW